MAPTKNKSSNHSCVDSLSVQLKSPIVSVGKNTTFTSSKSRWKILANAIKRTGTIEAKACINEYNENIGLSIPNLLRYPSYNLIHCRPLSKAHKTYSDTTKNQDEQSVVSKDDQQTWYQIVAQEYTEISLKVCLFNDLTGARQGY